MTSSDTLLADSVLAAATLVTGLQAGTYFTWATGVMPGVKYDAVAARRSWAGLDHFLGEIA